MTREQAPLQPYYTADGVTLHLGDSLDILPTLPDNSVDAVIEGFPVIGIERDPTAAALCVTRLSKPIAPGLFA